MNDGMNVVYRRLTLVCGILLISLVGHVLMAYTALPGIVFLKNMYITVALNGKAYWSIFDFFLPAMAIAACVACCGVGRRGGWIFLESLAFAGALAGLRLLYVPMFCDMVIDDRWCPRGLAGTVRQAIWVFVPSLICIFMFGWFGSRESGQPSA